MKLKVVIIDLEIPPRVKKWALRIGIPTVALLGGGALAYAEGLVTWSSGQTLHATDLNDNFTYLQGEIAALQGQVHPASAFRATLSNATNIANNTSTQIVFNNVLFDLGGEYDAAAGVFTPKNAGTYLVMCDLEVASGATNGGWYVDIFDGQNAVIGTAVAANAYAGSVETEALTQLAAGDAVSCSALEETGGNQSLYLGYTGHNTFSATRLY